jgi:hypothetical protein
MIAETEKHLIEEQREMDAQIALDPHVSGSFMINTGAAIIVAHTCARIAAAIRAGRITEETRGAVDSRFA